MKPFVNTLAVSQTALNSAALSPLGTVAHALADPGVYEGLVLQAKRVLGSFEVEVTGDAQGTQVDLDLARYAAGAGGSENRACEGERHSVLPGGYLVLYVSRGARGLSVQLRLRSKQGKGKKVFDSTKLGPSDLFVATLLRPGTWRATHSASKGTARIEVEYPSIGKKPYVPAGPLELTATAKCFGTGDVRVGTGQGVILRAAEAGSFKLELIEPNDGPNSPEEANRRGFRWRRESRG